MLMKFSALVLMIAVFFGGAATAVQAADVSLPGQAMYQLKIMIEDAQETMAGPVVRVQQSMQQVETRIQEILRLRAQGKEIPETAFVLLDNQLEKTLRYMIKLSDDELVPVLAQVRTRLLAQEQKLGELQNQEQENEDAVLDRIRTMLQDRLGVIGDGTKDPQQFKLEIQDRDRDRSSWTDQGNPPANGEGSGAGPANENQGTGGPSQNGTGPGAGSGAGEPAGGPTEGGYGPGPGAGEPSMTGTPVQDGTGPGPGPGPAATPEPGSGFGPGPGEPSATCTPVQDGSGPGPGSGVTPNPGSGSGPGPGAGEPTVTCTPLQDGTGPGPGPGAGATPTPGGAGSGGKP